MRTFFRRQLSAYAEYHRDERNCLTHLLGIPILFFAAILPLSLVSVNAWGLPMTLAGVMVVPALILWILLDVGVGCGIVAAVLPLLVVGGYLARHVDPVGVWIATGSLIVIGWTLQLVGHVVFEGRRPAFVDNAIHLLIGPMFVIAKLYIALGFRGDLAVAVGQSAQMLPETIRHADEERVGFYRHP